MLFVYFLVTVIVCISFWRREKLQYTGSLKLDISLIDSGEPTVNNLNMNLLALFVLQVIAR